MSEVQRVFLVGPMGTGKTTIGNQLAKALNFEFIDADEALEKRTGASITLIFDVEGEQGFREREEKILDDLTQRKQVVLATGGGAVLREANRAALSERGFVVYLRSPVETLIERTRFDTSRPLLKTEDPAATLREIMENREPLYEAVADLIVDTETLNIKQIVKRIADELQC
ncbi:MAG: shikimate kinase AroK [Gammaproteobacteria bacterium]